MILTVDLAARFSAAMLRDREGGEIHHQFDSLDKSHFDFAAEVAQVGRRDDVSLIVFEDVPYGISSQAMVKPVLKYQGIMMAVLHPVLDRVTFLAPATWMKMFPGVQRAPKGLTKTQADASRIAAAAEHAQRLGYTPPDLVQAYIDAQPEGTKILKKNTNKYEKAATDYVSAFLMSEYVRSISEEDFRNTQGVSPAYI